MDNLETNVAKISLGNPKQTSTYVATLAEKSLHQECELFGVVSLPLLNPAALEDCERISGALTAAFKRSFKRGCDLKTFENSLNEINEEMGKLASLGQQNWTGKVSALVAVRKGSTFYVASTGKTKALLIRDGELNEITEASESKHPLKTFDTFSNGKIKSQDIIILTTAELFNHLSLDRIKKILETNTLELGAQEILQLLEDNAGPEVAFGTLLIQESESSVEGAEATLSASDFGTDNSPFKEKFAKNAKKVLNKETALNIWKSLQSVAKKPKVSVDQIGKIAEMGGQGFGIIRDKAKQYKNFDYKAPIQNFRTASRPKQFFIISIIILVIAISANITISQNRKKTLLKTQVFEQSLASIETLINDADSKLLFKDSSGAISSLSEAESKLLTITPESEEEKTRVAELSGAIDSLRNKILNITPANIENLGTLSGASHLIVNPGFLATATGQTIVSYDLATGQIEDGKYKTSNDILNSVNIDSLRTVIFDGQGLRVWTPSSGESGEPFYQNIPKPNFLAAMDRYETNGRVYILDTEKAQITSFLVSDTTISRPSVSISNAELENAYDIAIDGSIYVLGTAGVKKYTAGKEVPYTLPELNPALNPAGKIYTSPKTTNVYILDPTGRIIITDKKGTLIKILSGDQLKGAQDFSVNEPEGIVYVLNSGSLLKVNLN